MIDTNDLRKAAKAVFLATEESVAEVLRKKGFFVLYLFSKGF